MGSHAAARAASRGFQPNPLLSQRDYSLLRVKEGKPPLPLLRCYRTVRPRRRVFACFSRLQSGASPGRESHQPWRSGSIRRAATPRNTRRPTRSGSPSPTQVRSQSQSPWLLPLPFDPCSPSAVDGLFVIRSVNRRRAQMATGASRGPTPSSSSPCPSSPAPTSSRCQVYCFPNPLIYYCRVVCIDFVKSVSPLKVWAIADSKRQGYLGFSEFVTAMQVFLPFSMPWLYSVLPSEVYGFIN